MLKKSHDTDEASRGAPQRCNRREFIELGALSSASLFVASLSAHGSVAAINDETRDAPARFGEFQSLPPGDIKPEGWLRLYLQKQAEQLAGQLPNVSFPFTGKYWEGAEVAAGDSGLEWWPWEQKAYWVDGAIRCALALHDQHLLRIALAPIEFTFSHISPDGYIGPAFAKDAKEKNSATSNYRWFHTVFFRALAAHGEATKNPSIAEALRRHYIADRDRINYGGRSRDVTNIEGMLWAYQRTGDRQLLAMAEKAWADFTQSAVPGDRESGDLHPDRVYANTPIHAHGVTYIEKAKLPAILYLHSGNSEYLRFALAAQERIFNHHMLIDGIPSTSEEYSDTTPLDVHETCDISDHVWSWGYLLMATGDGVWADHIERACFNAGMGAIRKDWKAIQYFSCPNQVIATHDSNHVPLVPDDTPWMAFCPNPGHESACCGGNVHRLLPNYVIRMWMYNSQDGSLAATLYGASSVRARVGSNGQIVEIHEETNYPFDEEVRFTVQTAVPLSFPLLLRIPSWCSTPHLSVNANPQDLPPIHKGFARLERTFYSGDHVVLKLPMKTVQTFWPGSGLGFENGPLVFSLPVKEEWTPTVTPKWSTAEFPEWDATAETGWNYGVVVDESSDLSTQPELKIKEMTEDPWMIPPRNLIVSMKKLPGWQLRADLKHPERKQTPPLPMIDDEMSATLSKMDAESIALVPYGSTQLRVTVFPKV